MAVWPFRLSGGNASFSRRANWTGKPPAVRLPVFAPPESCVLTSNESAAELRKNAIGGANRVTGVKLAIPSTGGRYTALGQVSAAAGSIVLAGEDTPAAIQDSLTRVALIVLVEYEYRGAEYEYKDKPENSHLSMLSLGATNKRTVARPPLRDPG